MNAINNDATANNQTLQPDPHSFEKHAQPTLRPLNDNAGPRFEQQPSLDIPAPSFQPAQAQFNAQQFSAQQLSVPQHLPYQHQPAPQQAPRQPAFQPVAQPNPYIPNLQLHEKQLSNNALNISSKETDLTMQRALQDKLLQQIQSTHLMHGQNQFQIFTKKKEDFIQNQKRNQNLDEEEKLLINLTAQEIDSLRVLAKIPVTSASTQSWRKPRELRYLGFKQWDISSIGRMSSRRAVEIAFTLPLIAVAFIIILGVVALTFTSPLP